MGMMRNLVRGPFLDLPIFIGELQRASRLHDEEQTHGTDPGTTHPRVPLQCPSTHTTELSLTLLFPTHVFSTARAQRVRTRRQTQATTSIHPPEPARHQQGAASHSSIKYKSLASLL